MARTDVTVTTLTANSTTADPAGTAADATNGHSIDPGGPVEEVVLRIKQTDASARVATIKAGVSPPALESGQGDLTKSMAQNEVWWVGPLTSGRFIQANGQIYVDLAASFAGTVTAFHVPRTA
jgi:hypothetical protein